MYQKKPPKREKISREPYTIMRYDKRPMISWTQDYHQVVSIDPATDTYAFRIEKRGYDGNIVPLAFERVKFNRLVGENQTNHLYAEISEFLDNYQEYYQDCHMFLVERQMVPNYLALKVAQHTISYFMNVAKNSPLVPLILDVNPTLKGNMLQAPKGLSYDYLKKWGVAKAKELLEMRDDTWSIHKMESYGAKQDDMADTVIMIEAVFKMWNLRLTVDVRKPRLTLIKSPELIIVDHDNSDIPHF